MIPTTLQYFRNVSNPVDNDLYVDEQGNSWVYYSGQWFDICTGKPQCIYLTGNEKFQNRIDAILDEDKPTKPF